MVAAHIENPREALERHVGKIVDFRIVETWPPAAEIHQLDVDKALTGGLVKVFKKAEDMGAAFFREEGDFEERLALQEDGGVKC